MVLQLYWENPLVVSTSDIPHSLRLIFNGQAVFADVNGNQIKSQMELTKEIPRQIDPSVGAELDLVATLAADTTKFVFSTSFLLNLLFIGGLSSLLQMIQNLSKIVHMQLVNIKTPVNAQIFFSKLLSIVAFDIIDGTPIEDWMVSTL